MTETVKTKLVSKTVYWDGLSLGEISLQFKDVAKELLVPVSALHLDVSGYDDNAELSLQATRAYTKEELAEEQDAQATQAKKLRERKLQQIAALKQEFPEEFQIVVTEVGL